MVYSNACYAPGAGEARPAGGPGRRDTTRDQLQARRSSSSAARTSPPISGRRGSSTSCCATGPRRSAPCSPWAAGTARRPFAAPRTRHSPTGKRGCTGRRAHTSATITGTPRGEPRQGTERVASRLLIEGRPDAVHRHRGMSWESAITWVYQHGGHGRRLQRHEVLPDGVRHARGAGASPCGMGSGCRPPAATSTRTMKALPTRAASIAWQRRALPMGCGSGNYCPNQAVRRGGAGDRPGHRPPAPAGGRRLLQRRRVQPAREQHQPPRRGRDLPDRLRVAASSAPTSLVRRGQAAVFLRKAFD